MSRNPLVRITKLLLDFMFYFGILICLTVPFIFKVIGRYYTIFEEFYLPFCIIFMVSGVFALLLLWELRKIFKTVMLENPFLVENVVSLQRMGICSFVISICMIFRLVFIITPAELLLVGVFLIAGLFSIVLSLVFDRAVSYKEENDLTI